MFSKNFNVWFWNATFGRPILISARPKRNRRRSNRQLSIKVSKMTIYNTLKAQLKLTIRFGGGWKNYLFVFHRKNPESTVYMIIFTSTFQFLIIFRRRGRSISKFWLNISHCTVHFPLLFSAWLLVHQGLPESAKKLGALFEKYAVVFAATPSSYPAQP